MGDVIFRLDDVQDGWLVEPQLAIFDLFTKHSKGVQPLVLGVIGRAIVKESKIFSKITSLLEEHSSLLEIACHSHAHNDFTKMSYSEQEEDLLAFNSAISEQFPDAIVLTFIPPFNNYNNHTVEILKKYNYEIISGRSTNLSDRDLFDNPSYMHASTTTNSTFGQGANFRNSQVIIEELNRQLTKETDWCAVMLHPQEFSINLTDAVDETAINLMSDVIDWCLDNGHNITTFSNLRKKLGDINYVSKHFDQMIFTL